MKITPDNIQKMLQMRQQNYSVADIARRFGVARQTVYNYLRTTAPRSFASELKQQNPIKIVVVPASQLERKPIVPFSMAAMQGGDPFKQLHLAQRAQSSRGRI